MAEILAERYVIKAIGDLLRSSTCDVGSESSALKRFCGDLSVRLGRHILTDEIQNIALDELRHLSVPSRGGKARKFVLLTRCDIRGEAHKVVAADLSLSRSQFYRDLRSARLALGRVVERNFLQETSATAVDAFHLHVATIRALHSCGRTEDAIAAAGHLAGSLSGADSIVARCLIVQLLADDYRIDAAERERARIPTLPSERDKKFAWAAVIVLITDATLALARLDQDAVSSARKALAATAGLDERQGRDDAEAHATSILARALMESGALAEGHSLLELYDRTASRKQIPPSLRAALITARSGLYQSEPWALCKSYEQARRLLQCAIANELPRPGIDALTDFASLLCKQDKLDTARPFARAALANARSVGSHEQVAIALGTLSMVSSESGHATEGLRAAEELMEKIGGAGVWGLQGIMLRSLALLRLGRIEDSLISCRRLAKEATVHGDLSLLGVAKRFMAEAYGSRGSQRKALTEIDDSVSLLEGVGRPYMLSRSYGVSHRLSGNARHGSLARSLREALQDFDAESFLPGGVSAP